jgi:hypothetical protein
MRPIVRENDNRPMFQLLTPMILAGAAALGGCSPTLDWREVRVASTGLRAAWPCKPEKEARQVTLGGHQVSLQALACAAGGGTFAVLFADIGGPASAGEVLEQWRTASLAAMRSGDARVTRFHPPGALDLPGSVRVIASGLRPDGSKVESHGAYFARGQHVFQAVVYSGRLHPELVDPFFSGLKFE